MKDIMVVLLLSFSWIIIYFFVKLLFYLFKYIIFHLPGKLLVFIVILYSGTIFIRYGFTRKSIKNPEKKILRIGKMIFMLERCYYRFLQNDAPKIFLKALFSEKIFRTGLNEIQLHINKLEEEQAILKCFSRDDDYKIYGDYYVKHNLSGYQQDNILELV